MSRPCKIKIKQQRRVLIGGEPSRSYEKLMPVILRAAAALATGYSAHPWASPWRAVASDVQICSRQICRSPESLTGVSSSGLTHLPPCRNSNYLGHRIVMLRAAAALVYFNHLGLTCREVAAQQSLFLLRRFFLLFEPGPDAGFLTTPQTLYVVVMAQQNQA